MKRALAAALLALVIAPPASAQGGRPPRVVVFTLPGVTWRHIVDAQMPTLRSMIDLGAVASMSVRTGFHRSSTERGSLTLGAGNRAFVPDGEPAAHLAFAPDAPFENGTAQEALARRFGEPRAGGIVHLGLPEIASYTRQQRFGSLVGLLGETLHEAGKGYGVVSAADLAPDARGAATRRRSAVLAAVDRRGTVTAGTLEGLVRADPSGAFGVVTDAEAFVAAAGTSLTTDGGPDLLVLDPGETSRADEAGTSATPERRERLMSSALERADAILDGVVRMLGPDDRIYVLAPSSPAAAPTDQLVPIVAYGGGIERGWLTSATTRRDGIVTLTDVAPTVLDALGVERPPAMSYARIRDVPTQREDRLASMIALNDQSLFRERFVTSAATGFIGLLSLLAVLAFVSFLTVTRTVVRILPLICFAIISTPPATLAVRLADPSSIMQANLLLWSLVAVAAIVASLLPGPRWTGGAALLIVSAAVLAADVVGGGALQLNAAFGHSPIVAGRFYGIGNLGFAILFATGILGLCGLADIRDGRRTPWWLVVGLVALLVVDGLPVFGADFGGMVAGVPAVLVTLALVRSGRLRWRQLAVAVVAGVALAAVVTMIDLSRPPDVRTHLGRFAAMVAAEGPSALWAVVRRKGAANIRMFGFSAWTYTIPLTLAVLALLLWRPRGVLRDVLPRRPYLRAGLAGALVAGTAGYAVNDSGVAIPAMVLGHVVPFLVLLAVQVEHPRKP